MEEGTARPSRLRSSIDPTRIAVLLGLCSLAITQPLLGVFGASPETFIVLDVDWQVLAVWLIGLTVAAPTALWLLETLAQLIWPRIGQIARVLTAATPVGLIAARLMNNVGAWPTMAVVAVVGLAVGTLIERIAFAKSWAAMAAVAAPLFVLLFAFAPSGQIFSSGDANHPSATGANDTPVVMIVFDEFPTASLLDGNGAIDEALFPGFARLASESTWYRNATTVAPRTLDAVPSIVTGDLPPADGRAPLSDEYGDTIFTLLADSHSEVAFEQITGLCPRRLCEDRRTAPRRNSLSELRKLTNSTYEKIIGLDPDGRPATFLRAPFSLPAPKRFNTFLEQVDGAPGTFDFLHTLSPHVPHRYTGEGIYYDAPHYSRALFSGRWLDESAATLARQRHLEQVRLVDAEMNDLLDHLERLGRLDETMIIVTADHGTAYHAGDTQRGISTTNASDIVWVPLFVKYPGEEGGEIDDRTARTIDIVPTVIDVLGATPPADATFDGHSLLDQPTNLDSLPISDWELSPLRSGGGAPLEIDAAKGFADLLATPPFNADVSGRDGLYALGPHGAALFGKPVDEFVVLEPSGEKAYVDPEYADLTRTSEKVAPLYVVGQIGRPPSEEYLAVAVNGIVASVVPTSVFDGFRATSWWTLLPEEFVDMGSNELSLYIVGGTPEEPTLTPLTIGTDPV